jgi:predicted negative regulator of RcsB-dependent stress response
MGESQPRHGSIRVDDRPFMPDKTLTSADARGLLDRASVEPAEVLAEARGLIDVVEDPDSKSLFYRAMSVAVRHVGTLDDSIEYARAAAEAAVDGTLRLEALGTMVGSLAMSGDVTRALRILDEAQREASGLIAAQLEFQRGVVLTIKGDYDSALAAYNWALPRLRKHHRADFVSMVLHNKGFIYTHIGRLDEAEKVLGEARQLEEAAGRLQAVSGVDHNLGLLASFRGDVPEALRRLTMSDEAYMRQTGDEVPQHVSRCEILISVGLFHEALDLAKGIAAGARTKGRAEDEADALLVAARAALLSDNPVESIRLATVAKVKFEKQQREVWASQAELVVVEATYASDGASAELRDLTREVAAHLEERGFVIAAARARILAGRIALDLGDSALAEEDLTALGNPRSGPVELRIQRWQAEALLRLARGNARGADAAARAGLDLLDDYQAGLGASDLRFGIERQGAELGAIGLRLAVDSGKARRVFNWMERTRARALRYSPVVPDEGDPEQGVLAELRWVSAELRDPEKRDDLDLVRKQRRLQEQLRGSNRVRRSGAASDSDFSIGLLLDSLGDRTLVELGAVDGRLLAVEVRSRRFTVHEIGDAATIERELSRLRSTLRRAARMRRDSDLIRDSVGRFDQTVLGSLAVEGDEVVLVPSGPLMAAPWAVLPSFTGAVVSVSPSAEMWWRANSRDPSGKGVVLAAGPDLDNATREIAYLKSLYPRATVLDPSDTADRFGTAVRGAAVAHAACHASFQVDNPMFSSLRLGDGDFNVYDLERLHHPPDLMVLSACDSGYTDTRAGDELTGVTSALLSMGAKSVVASVGLVPDSEATSDLMVAFHRGLISGATPAQALATAQSHSLDTPDGYIAAASFLCIGG